MRKITKLFLFSLFLALPLEAVSMHVLAWDQKIAGRDLAIAYGQKSEPILNMHHFARSSPIKIPAKSQNLHVVVSDRVTDEGHPLTLTFEIPAGITRPLLMLLPDKSPAGIKALVLDDSISNFRWGSLRFINVTREDLIFRHEKKNTLIPTGWKPTSVSPGGESRNMGVSLYMRKDLKLPPLYSSIWKHREDLRQLVFIVPSTDKERGHIDFKFIVENKSAVEAMETKAAKL